MQMRFMTIQVKIKKAKAPPLATTPETTPPPPPEVPEAKIAYPLPVKDPFANYWKFPVKPLGKKPK